MRTQLAAGVGSAMDRAGQDVMQWGRDDCALWCADILRDVLGYDGAEPFRGRYRTARGARRVLGSGGLKSALRTAARRHGWKRINPESAQAGDIGLAYTIADGSRVLATVVCRAPGWFVGRNETGFAVLPARSVVIAWSVLPDALPSTGPLRRLDTAERSACHAPVIAFVALAIETLGVAAETATLIASVVVPLAVSIGVSLVASLFQPHSATGSVGDDSILSTPTQESVQVTERQALPSKRVIFGQQYVGGALFFEQVSAPFLYQGILMNHGLIQSVEKVFIGTNELSFAAITPNTILFPLGVEGQPDYPDRLICCFRYGADSQSVDPIIASAFPSFGPDFRQRGIATAIFRYDYGADQAEYTALWGQVARPSAYMIVNGVAVYDPRDPTQSLADETTWKWSDNASLVQATYLTRDWGGRIDKNKILWDKVADAANYDDDAVGCADGTFIKRYTINGVVTLDQSPYDVMTQLLTANRGYILESGGRVWVSSSRPRTPIATLHDGLWAGPISYQSMKAKRDQVNKLQVRFVAAEQDYQVVDGPILSRTDLQASDQEVLPATLALNFTQDYRRAERLQKAFLESARIGRTITCVVDMDLFAIAADELIGNVLTVDSALFPQMNGTYLVASVGFADDLSTLSLALTEYDATIETNWNPATDEQPFTLAAL